MPKPICVPCGLFFRPEHNGFVAEEGKPYPDPDGKPIRYIEESGVVWTGYKLWRGDKWMCRGCGARIMVGFAGNPIREHYQADYETVREGIGGDEILFVHDC